RSLHALTRAVGADGFRYARERIHRAAAVPEAERDLVWRRAWRRAVDRVAQAWRKPLWGFWRRWVV
ncbi:MAG TPA: hypothetical protein VF950_26045, partial [Planctomycetota bacterium]